MSRNRIEWIGRHEGLLRDVARGCAWGSPESCKAGASILAPFIPDGSILVPMPSHIGYPTTMKCLCKWIAGIIKNDHGRGKVNIWCGLKCEPHESSHIVKLHNGVPPKIGMYLSSRPPEGNLIVIDNTIATGATANAALSVLPNAMVLAITKSN